MNENNTSSKKVGYGKRPIWQWLLIYLSSRRSPVLRRILFLPGQTHERLQLPAHGCDIDATSADTISARHTRSYTNTNTNASHPVSRILVRPVNVVTIYWHIAL